MAESVTCDQCGLTEDRRYGLSGWFEVDRYGEVDVRVMGDGDGPWHFCDLTCLRGWGERVDPTEVS